MRILAAIAAIATLAGCRCREDPARSGSAGRRARDASAETDALWALAPAGARGGLVASSRAVAMIERAVADVRDMLDRSAELAPWRRELDDVLRTELGISTVSLAELGLTGGKGLALFLVRDGMVAILPVADRARFLARAAGTAGSGAGGSRGGDDDRIGGATCRAVRGVYACATSAALLDTLGGGDLGAELAAVGARGDLELVGIELPLGGAGPGRLAAVVQLARGAAVIRGAIRGVDPALAERAAGAHRPRVDPARTSGFAVADVPALAGPAAAGGPLEVVVRSLRGPLAITVPAGGATLEAEQALADPAPARALLARCPELLAPLGIAAEPAPGPGPAPAPAACRLSLPAAGLPLDLWISDGGDLLRLGRRGAVTTGAPIPMTPIGAELAGGAWGLALWGRGTLIRAAGLPAGTGPLEDDAILSIRALALIDELGAAVRREGADGLAFVLALRTAFANPDDVVAKLLALSADDLVSGRAAAAAKSIADAAPGAPFAADLAAGDLGLLIPTTVMNAAIRHGLPALLRRRRPAAGPGE